MHVSWHRLLCEGIEKIRDVKLVHKNIWELIIAISPLTVAIPSLGLARLAKILQLSPGTVKKNLRNGTLRGIRTCAYAGKWRVSFAAVEEFMNRTGRQS